MNRVWPPRRLALAFPAVLALGLLACARSAPAPSSGDIPAYGHQPTESAYRAVLLSDGMVLFGRLHGLGTPFPVLTDVFYVQTVPNPKTHQPASMLVKRGKEWHAPDRTVLNASQIIMIEPVSQDSKVMQLIKKEDQVP